MVIRITSSIIFVKTKYGIIHYKVSSNGFIQNKEFISLDATWMLRLFLSVGITKFTIPKLVF